LFTFRLWNKSYQGLCSGHEGQSVLGKLRSIQVLRGLAACAVVFLHATGSGLRGAAGVDLFFVISGFIMATIPKGQSFLLDRFWRIFPLWWIALLPWLFTARTASTLIGSFTLLPVAMPALIVGWTLSFELLFYLAVAWSLRVGTWPLIGGFIVMAGAAAVTHAAPFNFLGNPMILEFLFGVVIAKLPRERRLSLPLLVFALVCFTFAPTWVYSPELAMRAPASAWRVLYWGVPSAMIVYAFLSIEHLFAGRVWAFPVLLGDASYSIYLFHLLATDNLHLWWPLELAAGVGIGLVAWALIERPIIRAKKRLMVVFDRPRNGVAGGSGEVPLHPALVRAEINDRVR
jgi:exopolysaccharide production protein ExoZ